ncbi:MAG: MCE family protein [Deltaproteobacteria bacterium]|nr:MCE family protein [Deltaproteobacteria bacterium]
MLEERAIQIRVGLFVLTGALLAGIIIFMLGSEREWFRRKYALRVRFEDIGGLQVGAAVQLSGMRVGSVKDIRFPGVPEERHIEVILKIDRRYQTHLRKDSLATIQTQGLLGDKFVQLTMGSPGAPALVSGDDLAVGAAQGMDSLMARSEELLDEVRNAASLIKDFFRDRSPDSVAHLLFYDPRGRTLFEDMSRSVRSLSRTLARFESETVAGDLADAAADVRAVTGQVRRGEGTLGGLLTDASIYHDLRSLFGKANRSLLLKTIVRSTLRENDRKSVELP